MKGLNSQLLTGLSIVFLGVLLLLAKLDMLFLPDWFFTWPVLLIFIGVLIGFRNRFTNASSLILIFIGGFFLAAKLIDEPNIAPYFWPVLLIAGGLWFIFSPKNYFDRKTWDNLENKAKGLYQNIDSDDILRSTVIFSGVKKTMLSKNFRGGESVNVLGGTEINLADADIEGVAVLELTQILGGTKLIVPPHWEIRSEVVAILGGLEDKRRNIQVSEPGKHVLILRGTTILGGIEIK